MNTLQQCGRYFQDSREAEGKDTEDSKKEKPIGGSRGEQCPQDTSIPAKKFAHQPLSNIFSATSQSTPLNTQRFSPSKNPSPPKVPAFKVAEDVPIIEAERQEEKGPGDSGYHGAAEDEMDVDPPTVQSSAPTHDTLEDFPHSPPRTEQPEETNTTGGSTTERSFHSAKEEITKRGIIDNVEVTKVDGVQVPDATGENQAETVPQATSRDAMDLDVVEKEVEEDLAVESSRTSSQNSTPARQLVRKSSLTFAALPAREPITTKKSMGAQASRSSQLETAKTAGSHSILNRLTGGKSLGGVKNIESDEVADREDDQDRPQLAREESDNDSKAAKLHNKSSTQRLHDRINMLGKSQPPRPTKSIPAATLGTQPQNPDLSKQEQARQPPQQSSETVPATSDEDEDDWIQPPRPQNIPQARATLNKSASADVEGNSRSKESGSTKPLNQKQHEDPISSTVNDEQPPIPNSRPVRSASESQSPMPEHIQPEDDMDSATVDPFYPDLGIPADASTTPIASTSSKRYVDGPLSASKSKLQSIMKTARGLFSSSAGVSAQAKMETMSPSLAPRNEARYPESISNARSSPPRAEDKKETLRNAQQSKDQRSDPAASEPRKTRSSTEKEERRKEKEMADRQQMEAEKEKVRQQEAAIEANANLNEPSRQPVRPQEKATRQSPRRTQNQDRSTEEDSRTQGRPSQATLKDVRRPTKPSKDPAPKAKAPPLNIRIGMPSRRMPLNNTAASSSVPEQHQGPQSKPPGLVKKASNASIQSTVSNAKPKATTVPAKPKALKVAERKKEQVGPYSLPSL